MHVHAQRLLGTTQKEMAAERSYTSTPTIPKIHSVVLLLSWEPR